MKSPICLDAQKAAPKTQAKISPSAEFAAFPATEQPYSGCDELNLVFIDSSIDELEFLSNGLLANYRVFTLPADQDGVTHITHLLTEYEAVSSLHIVCHGSPGTLQLGSTELTLASIYQYESQLTHWAKFFSADAQIQFYGCHVAAGLVGSTFVQTFSKLTRTQVAASSTPVGSSKRGGNWTFDYRTGDRIPQVAFNAKTIDTYPSVFMDHGSMAHPTDPAKASEHQALMDLVPVNMMMDVATHRAVASGSWFDPNTWSGGQVPTHGAIVHIPQNISVTYEGVSNVPLFAVRLDGDLTFTATDGTDTKIVVDTFITTPHSRFEIDADAATDGTVDIEIRPFDIEAHEAMGAPGWSTAAINHYSDGATVRDTGAGTRTAVVYSGPQKLDRCLSSESLEK